MKTISHAIIKKAIVHSLNNTQEHPVLSDFELDLTEALSNFINIHILRCLADEKIKAAAFDEGRNIVKESTGAIFNDFNKFLVESKEIAKELFSSMRTNKNISSGDLIVTLFEGNGKDYLAVLKLDYQNTFMSEIKSVNGKFKITITDKGISLPNIRQKLQKAVVIQKFAEDNLYDLMILDKQTKEEKDIANYFSRFLKCTLVMNDNLRTKQFYLQVNKWIDINLKDQPEEEKRVKDSLRSTLTNQAKVDVTEFAKSLFEKEETVEKFLQFLANEGLTDFEFKPDKAYVESKYKKIKVKTSEGIEISLSGADYDNPQKFDYSKVEGTTDRYNISIKNVKITDWGV